MGDKIVYRITKWRPGAPIGSGVVHKTYETLKAAEGAFIRLLCEGWQGGIEKLDEDGSYIESAGSYLDDKYDGPHCWKNRGRPMYPSEAEEKRSFMNKLVLPNEDSVEYRGAVLALIKNGYVVYGIKVSVAKAGVNEWQRWIYYCRLEHLAPFIMEMDEYEEQNR